VAIMIDRSRCIHEVVHNLVRYREYFHLGQVFHCITAFPNGYSNWGPLTLTLADLADPWQTSHDPASR